MASAPHWIVGLALAGAAGGGCALEASVRVVTTATERCEWRETVALGGPGDRFRVPEHATEAALLLDGVPVRTLAAGARLELRRNDATGRYTLLVDDAPAHTADTAPQASVTWWQRSETPLRAEQDFPLPDAPLPWTIDWEVRPAPRRVADGECRLDDVETLAELIGPDADALVLDATITPGRVQGTVRRRDP